MRRVRPRPAKGTETTVGRPGCGLQVGALLLTSPGGRCVAGQDGQRAAVTGRVTESEGAVDSRKASSAWRTAGSPRGAGGRPASRPVWWGGGLWLHLGGEGGPQDPAQSRPTEKCLLVTCRNRTWWAREQGPYQAGPGVSEPALERALGNPVVQDLSSTPPPAPSCQSWKRLQTQCGVRQPEPTPQLHHTDLQQTRNLFSLL